MPTPLVLIGWREWVTLPELGIAAIRGKVDTGARSSSLHVDHYEMDDLRSPTRVRFGLHRAGGQVQQFEHDMTDYRAVRDSSGHEQMRPFIRTRLAMAGQSFDIEINLADRRNMRFPLLLGRTAIARRFTVDPAQSFLLGQHPIDTEVIR